MLLPFFSLSEVMRFFLSNDQLSFYQTDGVNILDRYFARREDSQRAEGIVRLSQFRHRVESGVCRQWKSCNKPSEHTASQTITGIDRFGYAYDRSRYKIIGQRD